MNPPTPESGDPASPALSDQRAQPADAPSDLASAAPGVNAAGSVVSVDAPPGALGAPPRFCGGCGAQWDPAWLSCPHCAPRPIAPAAPLRPEAISLKSALVLYFLILAMILFGAVATYALHERDGRRTFALELGEILSSLLVVFWAAARWRAVLPALRRVRVGWCLLAVVLAIPTFLLAHIVVNGLTGLLGAQRLEYSEPLLALGHGLGLVVLLVCVQPALIEEVAFRGLILGALRDLLSDREAIAVSAMMFMIIHCSVLSLPHLLTLGLVLAWLRVRTGSLWPGIVLHFTHNFLVVLSEQLKGSWP